MIRLPPISTLPTRSSPSRRSSDLRGARGDDAALFPGAVGFVEGDDSQDIEHRLDLIEGSTELELILFVIPLVWAAPFADPAAATDRIRDFDNTGGDNIAIAVDDVHQSLDLLGGAVREHACFFVLRLAERSIGKERVSPCRSWWWASDIKKKKKH